MSEERLAPDQDKPAAVDVEMKDAPPDAPADAPAAPKARGGRRKSMAGDSKAKALSKKGSKARLTHPDAKPGDHFLVKLKGFPAWPAIVCDETMLPHALLTSRPVSAARSDGSYGEAYADGGKRVHDRSFPVMYLYTNELYVEPDPRSRARAPLLTRRNSGWVQNTALSGLTADKAKDTLGEKMRKDLRAAFELAADDHPLDYYKDILKSFQEEQMAQEQARLEAAATPKKTRKIKTRAASDDDDADMDDVGAAPKSAKSKKRKANDDDTSVSSTAPGQLREPRRRRH